MSLLKQICFIVVGLVFLRTIKAETSNERFFAENYKGISADYFFGESSLRSRYVVSCKGDETILQTCYENCGHSNFRCIYNKCICIDGVIKGRPPKIDFRSVLDDIEKLTGIVRSLMPSSIDEEGDALPTELLQSEERPALRHHIAHFCPNLDVARTCIRTCMKVGKPAFCGKDHRCYCGHKYTDHDDNQKIDLNDMHAQFRDLYEKYFGTSAMDSMKNTEKPAFSSEET